MSATIELDEQRRSSALAKLARRRKMPLRRVLERAVDEFIDRAEDEDLLEISARAAQQTGLREADAVDIVRSWRRSHT
jgi:predicted transcriptional regulator